MKDPDSPTKITLKTLQSHRLSYESHVPDKIQGLESLRGVDIPETLTQRKKDGNAFLEKNEVMSLVEWKLYASSTTIHLHVTQALTFSEWQKAWHLPAQSRQTRRFKQHQRDSRYHQISIRDIRSEQ
jgi:hypothetical protein